MVLFDRETRGAINSEQKGENYNKFMAIIFANEHLLSSGEKPEFLRPLSRSCLSSVHN